MRYFARLKIDTYFLSKFAFPTILLGGFWVRVHGIGDYFYNPDEMEYLIIAKGESLNEV